VEENIAFHESFCQTQSLASFLADVFNARLCARQTRNPIGTPIITFLPCSVLKLKDPTVADGVKDVLVEKMLDTTRFEWCKWNDNGGGVEGRHFHPPIDVKYELRVLALSPFLHP
jgi:Alpha-kinase family